MVFKSSLQMLSASMILLGSILKRRCIKSRNAFTVSLVLRAFG